MSVYDGVVCVCENMHMEVREYTVVLVLSPCLTQELFVVCHFTIADHELPESSCLIFHLTARELELQSLCGFWGFKLKSS